MNASGVVTAHQQTAALNQHLVGPGSMPSRRDATMAAARVRKGFRER